jgi:hypothetical protein
MAFAGVFSDTEDLNKDISVYPCEGPEKGKVEGNFGFRASGADADDLVAAGRQRGREQENATLGAKRAPPRPVRSSEGDARKPRGRLPMGLSPPDESVRSRLESLETGPSAGPDRPDRRPCAKARLAATLSSRFCGNCLPG